MKEFEKQWENTACTPEAGNCDQLCSECKLIAAHWYRAALEWANKLFLNDMHPSDVIFTIQKELEDN